MTEQDSARVGSVVIMTSINERFVSVILVGSFTSCVKLKLAQSSLRVRLSTVSSRMLQFSSFLRRHFAAKPVVASRNVGCFLRLEFERLLPIFVDASSASCSRLFFFANSSPKFHISKEEGVAIKIP